MRSEVLVLDTNVVLDWLLFRDPGCAALDTAVGAGTVRWVASTAMRQELGTVLRRGWGRLRTADPDAILAGFDGGAALLEPSAAGSGVDLRCRDTSDQKFIDLALQLGDCTLLSRDKALLRLARRARARSVRILTPVQWTSGREAA